LTNDAGREALVIPYQVICVGSEVHGPCVRLGERLYEFQLIELNRHSEAGPVVGVQLSLLEGHELAQVGDVAIGVVELHHDWDREGAERVNLSRSGDWPGEVRDDADLVRLALEATRTISVIPPVFGRETRM
jgi:hypothetical protein